jgi:CheY-like chemotaxis protein
MGGFLTVESTFGHGSRFTLALPYHAADPAFDSNTRTVPEVAHVNMALQLLAVDDLPENLLLLKLLLADTPVVLTIVESGAAVLELLALQHFDALLTDMRMAGMDGITLVQSIRAEELQAGKRPLRIIALSANAYPEDKRAALEAGCDSYLSRPFDTNNLLREISAGVVAKTSEQADFEQQFDQLRHAAKERIAASVVAIKAALTRGDNVVIREEGHRIKGLGMSFGMLDAERIGAALEQAGRDGELEVAGELVEGFTPASATTPPPSLPSWRSSASV